MINLNISLINIKVSMLCNLNQKFYFYKPNYRTNELNLLPYKMSSQT